MRFAAAGLWMVGVTAVVCPLARAAEHVTLRNGFEVDCVRREVAGDRVRLYFAGAGGGGGGAASFLEVAADSVAGVETIADVPGAGLAALKGTVSVLPGATPKPASSAAASSSPAFSAPAPSAPAPSAPAPSAPTGAEMGEMLAHAGTAHHIDADLLASVVRAESGGHVRAVSRTGARGLMQLMPGTARDLGVQDAFQADQNIAGGTAYLDGLLMRYHDNLALALAAYNAGPAAVARYRGVPPFAETRAYVARVIREFNRRKLRTVVARVR